MAERDRKLGRYRNERNFRESSGPRGRGVSRWKENGDMIFVIQEHAASSRHYDFRLEVDGVLASWAVPKGPSTDPSEKRLAVRVEDHPLDYADFEGVIEDGEYGAGTVIVWDAGSYSNLKTDEGGDEVPVREALEEGHVEVRLEGEKLRGGYALVHARVGGEEENWLLVKLDDDAADARRNPVSTEPESVLSGRSVEEVEAEEKGRRER